MGSRILHQRNVLLKKKEVPLATLHYLPSIAFFSAIAKAQTLTLEQFDRWQKASFRNRTNISTANGLQTLSIPLVGGRGQKGLYREVQICYTENWQHQHWQSIVSAYQSAPFFEHYAPYFEPLYKKETILLFDFNLALFDLLLRFCKLDITISFSHEYQKENIEELDLRTQFLPNKTKEIILPYHQVFEEKNGFIADVSVLDLLFNEGPQAGNYLKIK